MQFIEKFLPNSLTHSYGEDILILLILFIIAAAYGYYRGKSTLISLILSFYPAILLFLNFPYVANFTIFKGSAAQIFTSKCIIFLIFLIPIHLILNRFISGDWSYGGRRKFFQIAILALSTLILVIVFFYRIVPLKDVYSSTLPVARYLSSSADFFFWLLVPFVGLFITK